MSNNPPKAMTGNRGNQASYTCTNATQQWLNTFPENGPAPKLTPTDERKAIGCGNCRNQSHLARICVRPGPSGYIECCGICDGNGHCIDECDRLEGVGRPKVLANMINMMVKNRNGLPPFQTRYIRWEDLPGATQCMNHPLTPQQAIHEEQQGRWNNHDYASWITVRDPTSRKTILRQAFGGNMLTPAQQHILRGHASLAPSQAFFSPPSSSFTFRQALPGSSPGGDLAYLQEELRIARQEIQTLRDENKRLKYQKDLLQQQALYAFQQAFRVASGGLPGTMDPDMLRYAGMPALRPQDSPPESEELEGQAKACKLHAQDTAGLTSRRSARDVCAEIEFSAPRGYRRSQLQAQSPGTEFAGPSSQYIPNRPSSPNETEFAGPSNRDAILMPPPPTPLASRQATPSTRQEPSEFLYGIEAILARGLLGVFIPFGNSPLLEMLIRDLLEAIKIEDMLIPTLVQCLTPRDAADMMFHLFLTASSTRLLGYAMHD
ncbi:hypothetical protein G7Y89_g1001 [Cudoniella acicularis]|uniref:Uncharacterized protein n=1 Tax=Cudoniella acicularis TaxID=354080 RepID=A0A8H4W9X9_9HELO|nr:hypothetical protein G7Y89_g1001 [Cudoniella acicularis]